MTEPDVSRLTVPARIDGVRTAASFFLDHARAQQVAAAANPLFEVAIVEALNNAVHHNVAAGDGNLRCEFEVSAARVIVRVFDERVTAPFLPVLPVTEPLPDFGPENWQIVPDSGYGLHLIRAVFEARPVTRDGLHGIELELSR